jgi:hypothetical protein
MLAYVSMQKPPQNSRRRSSSSVQVLCGMIMGAMGTSSSVRVLSRRCSPIMPASLTDRAELMDALVNSMARASSVATRAQACAWPIVMKCSPCPWSHVRVSSNQQARRCQPSARQPPDTDGHGGTEHRDSSRTWGVRLKPRSRWHTGDTWGGACEAGNGTTACNCPGV